MQQDRRGRREPPHDPDDLHDAGADLGTRIVREIVGADHHGDERRFAPGQRFLFESPRQMLGPIAGDALVGDHESGKGGGQCAGEESPSTRVWVGVNSVLLTVVAVSLPSRLSVLVRPGSPVLFFL